MGGFSLSEHGRKIGDMIISRRRVAAGVGVAAAGTVLVAAGGAAALGVDLFPRRREIESPYSGLAVEEYVDGFVFLNVVEAELRSAPNLNPSSLRDNTDTTKGPVASINGTSVKGGSHTGKFLIARAGVVVVSATEDSKEEARFLVVNAVTHRPAEERRYKVTTTHPLYVHLNSTETRGVHMANGKGEKIPGGTFQTRKLGREGSRFVDQKSKVHLLDLGITKNL
jgi:hypothetical protein